MATYVANLPPGTPTRIKIQQTFRYETLTGFYKKKSPTAISKRRVVIIILLNI